MPPPDRPDVVTERPLNAETPRAALDARLTPSAAFFVRNHFDVPKLDPERYLLPVEGLVRRVKGYTLAQLQRIPQRRVACVLECAGNGRARMVPAPPGVAWGDRAVGCAVWEGPALADVLAPSEPLGGAIEVLFRGADLGIEAGKPMHFERSLPWPLPPEEPILALRMNGEPLLPGHGAPVRLLVPGWYGVASVKWLVAIQLIARPFTGWFQRDRYVWDDGSPVQRLRPKSLILRPAEGAQVRAGAVSIEGKAWGGEGGIAEVVVRVDEGPWQPALLQDVQGPHAWHGWSHAAELGPGDHTLAARARDAKGIWQPLEPVVNKLGYGWNSAPSVRVRVLG